MPFRSLDRSPHRRTSSTVVRTVISMLIPLSLLLLVVAVSVVSAQQLQQPQQSVQQVPPPPQQQEGILLSNVAGEPQQVVTVVDACRQGADEDTYDLRLHIASIFIVLVVALVGTSIPVLGRYHPRYRIPDFVFLVLKSFGMGVILATGYVHMFPPYVRLDGLWISHS